MRVTIYQTKYTESRVISLVKETSSNYPQLTCVDSPENCARLMEMVFDASNLPEERLWMLAFDGARKVTGVFEVFHGSLMSSIVHPREIFSRAILSGAASIIIVHNHPSGSLAISAQDLEVTKTIKQAGDLMGIQLDDHLILAAGDFISAM